MDYLLSSTNEQKVIDTAVVRINALIANGSKESSVFCFGEDKHLILKNLRAFVRTITNVLGEHDYRVNPQAYDQVKKLYLQKLSERVGSLNDKTLRNCPGLFDVFKLTVACSLDGIPAIFISHYPQANPNVSVCGQYEQPEFTLRVPLIYGSSSIYNETNKNKSAMISFGISSINLKKVRTRLRGMELPKADKPTPKSGDKPNVEQPNAQSGGIPPDGEHEEASGSVPDHISHESTLVDSLWTRQVPVTRNRRATLSLR